MLNLKKMKMIKDRLSTTDSFLGRKVTLICILLLVAFVYAFPQKPQQKRYKIMGTVYELSGQKLVPLPFASVSFVDYSISAMSNANGVYALSKVPLGKALL